jgi:hypothetical protein
VLWCHCVHLIAGALLCSFMDGSEQKFEPMGMDVVEILSDVHQHAYVLNSKMEDEGKTLDER